MEPTVAEIFANAPPPSASGFEMMLGLLAVVAGFMFAGKLIKEQGEGCAVGTCIMLIILVIILLPLLAGG